MAKQLGIDIGTSSVKFLVSDSGSIKKIGIVPNKFGKLITLMTNSERIQFTDEIKKAMSDLGVNESGVVASLPESLTFSKFMKFPRMSTPELATAIKWELDQSVPFPPNEIESSWSVFEKNDVVTDDLIGVFVVAVPSKVSELYVQMFELLGLEPQRLENETVPQARANADLLSDSPTFLVDFGASGIKIVLASKTMIINNYYFAVGGTVMTKLIADNFGLTLDQAEQYKRIYGLQQDQLDGKIYRILKPIIDNFVMEIRKMTLTYKNDFGDRPINKMILTGGGCYLAGLIPYLGTTLEGMEISIGNVFEGVSVDANYQQMGPIFSLSFGLTQ